MLTNQRLFVALILIDSLILAMAGIVLALAPIGMVEKMEVNRLTLGMIMMLMIYKLWLAVWLARYYRMRRENGFDYHPDDSDSDAGVTPNFELSELYPQDFTGYTTLQPGDEV